MDIRVPLMIQDPTLSGHPTLKRIVERPHIKEDEFLDGPVCRRVAIRDVDPATWKPRPAVPFVPSAGGREAGHYQIADENDIYAADFMAVHVFGTVLSAMHMFEKADILGRPLAWGFDGPQLVVMPCMGQDANAFYYREAPNLRFYYFHDHRDKSRKVYTSLSRDIVSHETGHAILDGIAPRLWDATTPESLALHESIADLVAVVMSFRSGALRTAILKETGGSIANAAAFSTIAEEVGQAFYQLDCLRDLSSSPDMDQVEHIDKYALSRVLSSALYKMLMGMYDRWWQKLSGEGAALDYRRSGKALGVAVEHFKRMIFRALDYLPPAEVSFADYGRAIIAADQAAYPDEDAERRFIRREFAARGIVPCPEALDVQTNFEHAAVKRLDLTELVDSEAAAERFAEQNRDLLHIPAGTPFHVEPRLDVTKLYYHGGNRKERVRECLFKVRWEELEPNPLGPGWPPERQISVGTTLAIDWETQQVRAVLTTERTGRPKEAAAQRADRDAMLRYLAEMGVLQQGAASPAGIQADVSDGVLRIRSLAHM